MNHPDYYEAIELAQKRVGDQLRRSETENRLYWSTFRRMALLSPEPRKKIQVWMVVRWLLSVLRGGFHKRSQADMRVCESRSRTHSLIPKGRQV
jgi:hypothetical protein